MSKSRSIGSLFRLVAGFALLAAAEERLDETAPVIDVAAHRDPQRVVGAALRLHAGLVAVGHGEDREIRRRQIALVVEFDIAAHIHARAVDRDVLETGGLVAGQHGEGRAVRAAGGLHPAGQQIVDPGRRQIGFDREPDVLVVARSCRTASPAPVPQATGPVPKPKRARAASSSVARTCTSASGLSTSLAIVERRRRAIDADIALDLEARDCRRSPSAPALRSSGPSPSCRPRSPRHRG